MSELKIPPRRRWLVDFAIVLFSAGATILAAEIAIRLIKPAGMALVSPYVEQHPDYLFKVKSGLSARHRSFNFDARYFTDDRGLRTREKGGAQAGGVPAADGKTARRVLCIGDSVTFGIGVNGGETYPAQLQNFLNKMDPARRWETLNAGQPGWGTSQELLWLENEGFALNPDVIVVNFTLNDPHDDWTNGLMRLDEGNLVRNPQSRALESRFRRLTQSVPFYAFLCENSYLLTLLRKSVTVTLQQRGKKQRDRELPQINAQKRVDEVEETLLKFALSSKIMGRLIDESRQRGIPVLLAFSPWPIGTDKLEQANDPHAIAKAAFKPLQAPILDMNQHLIKVAATQGYRYKDVYIVGDGHMTPLGNRIVAEELARFVLENSPKAAKN